MSILTRQDLLESVTLQALEAAESGHWDQVKLCLDRREELLLGSEPSPAMAVFLVGLDGVIGEKIRLARAAVGQVLSEVAATRIVMDRFAHREARRDVGDRVDREV